MVCENCKCDFKSVVLHGASLWCWLCHNAAKGSPIGAAPSVHGDECDVVIQHGVCNPDGSPKRYRSKSEIREAAFQAGYFQGNDTPKVNQRLQETRAKQHEANQSKAR